MGTVRADRSMPCLPSCGVRSAGILLHVASLPGAYGIGTLGEEAYRWVDLMSACGVEYWQVLPLVQTSYGDSPYQSPYSGSGNPYLIDLELLMREGLLEQSELSACRCDGAGVDYAFLYRNKYAALRKAFARFDVSGEAFAAFEREGSFEGYALFMALKVRFGGVCFDQWRDEYQFARPQALNAFKAENLTEYLFWLFVQYQFLRQWSRLKDYANALGISILGDLPLYVAYDSADVWLNPGLFKLKRDRGLKKVAGVPPDYFSKTGQLWGNPVYRWAAHRREGYAWWIDRFERAFSLYDAVRLDHFRGFDRYYEIDAGAETAVRGVWKNGPKEALFHAAERAMGGMNVIAEDLGALDRGVYRLLRRTGYPGMKVLQFAFDGNAKNSHLPSNFGRNAVCYTGTHDNDTLLGYLASLNKEERAVFESSLNRALKEKALDAEAERIVRGSCVNADSESFDGSAHIGKIAKATEQGSLAGTAEAVISLALASDARLAVIPIQDVLHLDGAARMNTPSTTAGNWQFRLEKPLTQANLAMFSEKLKRFDRFSDRKG